MKILTLFSTIKAKIISLVISIIVLSVFAIGIGIINMTSLSHEMNNIVTYEMPFNAHLSTIRAHQLEQTIEYEKALRYAIAAQTNPVQIEKFQESVKGFHAFTNKIKKDIQKINAIVDAALSNISDPVYTDEFMLLKERMDTINKEHVDFEHHIDMSFKHISSGDIDTALSMTNNIEKEVHQIDNELSELTHEVETFVTKSANVMSEKKKLAISEMLIIGIVLIFTSILLSFFIIKLMANRLQLAVSKAQKIAGGDLTGHSSVSGNDEVSNLIHSMESMQDNLKNLVSGINDSSYTLASSSEQLSASSEQTNQGIHTQKSEIEQIATAITEMAATVQEVAKNTSETSCTTADVSKTTLDGNSLVQTTIESIESLNTEIGNASNVIHVLNDEISSITSVLDVIKGVAEQTNLLALNAAIEAARAGEHGRGFAVVADEVRTLAQRTQESTTDIENMIEKLQSGASKAVNAMNVSQERASVSVDNAEKTGKALSHITESISSISDMNTQIASAAEEQYAVAEEINRNIHNVTSNTDMIASASTEITASSVELAKTANKLNLDVQVFKIS